MGTLAEEKFARSVYNSPRSLCFFFAYRNTATVWLYIIQRETRAENSPQKNSASILCNNCFFSGKSVNFS